MGEEGCESSFYEEGDPSKLPPVGWALHMLIPFNLSCCPSEFTVGLVPEAAAHTLPGSSLPQGLTAPHSVTHSGSVQMPRLSCRKNWDPSRPFLPCPCDLCDEGTHVSFITQAVGRVGA